MAEQLLDNQPYITDEAVIAEFVKLGIDPRGKTSTQLNDEINTLIAKESANVVFDFKDPLDYLSAGLTLTGLGAGAGLGLKGLRTASKGKKAAENIGTLQKLKSLLSPITKKTPQPGPTVTPLSGGAPYTTVIQPKIPFKVKLPQTAAYTGAGVKILDESMESAQRADEAEILQQNINALKVQEIAAANQQIAAAKKRNEEAKKIVEEPKDGDGAPAVPPGGTQKPKSGVTNLFGSEQFVNFLRNVGSSLTETGQLGVGLAKGATKAAEERAAKELALELEKIKAGKQSAIKPDLKYKMDEDYINASTEISENAGSIDFLNQIEQMLQISDVTGLKAFGKQIGYKFRSLFNAQAKMDPKTAVENLLREISIGEAEDVLGQSSGRLSDKDIQLARQLVSEIEGLGGIIGSEDQILSILARRRSDLERAQAKAGTTLYRLENEYFRYGIRPPDTGLFDLLESINKRSKLENPEQDKIRIPLDPKEAALEEAGAN